MAIRAVIGSIAALLSFQLAGALVVRVTGLALPGPVLGMIALFVVLLVRGRTPDAFTRTCRGLLDHLALLFVPAGVGIITHLALVAEQWLAITVTLVASTTLTVVVTALVLRALLAFSDSP